MFEGKKKRHKNRIGISPLLKFIHRQLHLHTSIKAFTLTNSPPAPYHHSKVTYPDHLAASATVHTPDTDGGIRR